MKLLSRNCSSSLSGFRKLLRSGFRLLLCPQQLGFQQKPRFLCFIGNKRHINPPADSDRVLKDTSLAFLLTPMERQHNTTAHKTHHDHISINAIGIIA